MAERIREFIAASQATEEEARALLGICDYNMNQAKVLFPLHPRQIWTAIPTAWTFPLARFPLGMRNKVLKNFAHYSPRDVLEECSQGLMPEDSAYLAVVALRAFVNNNADADFAQTLQLGKTVLLPLFQEWAKQLKEMEKAPAESLERAAARERLANLLNETLPSMVEANPAFCGVVGDIISQDVRFGGRVAQTALHIAAKLGDLDLVKNLLASNAKFDAKDSYGNTPLHVGVNHPSIFEALLRAAERAKQLAQFVNHLNHKEQTALHLCRNASSAELLLRASPALLFLMDKEKNTALHFSVDHPDVVQVLLSAIKDARYLETFVKHSNRKGQTALHLCRNAVNAKLLLRAAPSLLFALDKEENTVLHLATETPDVVKVFFAAIPDAQQLEQFVRRVNKYGYTALHHCESAESARLLLRACPSLLFAKNQFRCTALHSSMNKLDVAEALLAAIPDAAALEQFVHQVDKYGRSALRDCHNIESAQLLLNVSPALLFVADQDGNTALHRQVDCPDMVKLFLNVAREAGQLERFVEKVGKDGETALHVCRNAESARLLLQASPSLAFAKDKYGRTVLHSIVDFPRVLDVVLAEIQDAQQLEECVAQADDMGRTVLHNCKKEDIARILLRTSPSLVFAEDRFGRTALHMHVNEPGVVGVLLAAIQDAKKLEQFVMRVDYQHQTALHLCNNAESAELLLRMCPGLLFAANSQGNNALHLHVDNAEIVKVLLNAAKEAGKLEPFVEQANPIGQTALHVCRDLEPALLLIEASPNVVSIPCMIGCMPLRMHAVRALEDTCRFLIVECGAVVNAANAKAQTPLHLACSTHHVETVALLLAHSAQVLARDGQERTVLHCALLEKWHEEAVVVDQYLAKSLQFATRSQLVFLVELLLGQGDAIRDELITARDANGRTALHYCATLLLHNNEVADKLMMAGADWNARDKQGDTTLHVAYKHGKLDFVIRMVKHWGVSIYAKNVIGKGVQDLVRDANSRMELERTSMLAGIVTLRLAAGKKRTQCPWKKLPHELFRELCSVLV